MQPPENLHNSADPGNHGQISCSQCGAPMPREMRFCRACGHRLGEDVAEYSETVKFGSDTTPVQRVTGAYIPPRAGPMVAQTGTGLPYKRRRRLGGMAWI